jgi:hypothetical protein
MDGAFDGVAVSESLQESRVAVFATKDGGYDPGRRRSSGLRGHWLDASVGTAAQYPCRHDAGAMTATLILIIVVALLCVALVVILGILWAALHLGVSEDDHDQASQDARERFLHAGRCRITDLIGRPERPSLGRAREG